MNDENALQLSESLIMQRLNRQQVKEIFDDWIKISSPVA